MSEVKISEWTVDKERERIARRILESKILLYQDRWDNDIEVLPIQEILSIIYPFGIN